MRARRAATAVQHARTCKSECEVRSDLEQGGKPRERRDVGAGVRTRKGIAEDTPVREQMHDREPERTREADDDRGHGRPPVAGEDKGQRRDGSDALDVAGPEHLGGQEVGASPEVVGAVDDQSDREDHRGVLQDAVVLAWRRRVRSYHLEPPLSAPRSPALRDRSSEKVANGAASTGAAGTPDELGAKMTALHTGGRPKVAAWSVA